MKTTVVTNRLDLSRYWPESPATLSNSCSVNYTGPMNIFPSLSKAFDLSVSTLAGIKKIKEVEVRMEVMEKMLQLQETIQLAKQDVFTLQDENMALSEKNKQLRKDQAEWHKHLQEANDYTLRQLAPNVYAYIKNDAGADLSKVQKFCQPCFEKGIKSSFNFENANFHKDTLSCNQCGLRIHVPNDS